MTLFHPYDCIQLVTFLYVVLKLYVGEREERTMKEKYVKILHKDV
jgi:hypothetical protein